MEQIKKIIIVILLITVGACSSKQKEISNTGIYANEEKIIVLQHPKTRMIVNCYPSAYQPAEFCAEVFEQKKYVRIKDIPSKPAKYDFLKGDAYPSRRWREGETTPRW